MCVALSQCNVPSEENQSATKENSQQPSESISFDEYTYSNPAEAVIRHLALDVEVNFSSRIISGIASYEIENKTGASSIILDSKGLEIQKVTLGDGESTEFALVGYNQYMGRKLEITISESTTRINIYYSTRPEAIALQWLNPQQTEEKKNPYLFTQSEPCLARTWIPTQDSPGIRFTYSAKVQVPVGLMAVMSASNPQEKSADGIYNFEMKQPIPAYLMALAVGDFVFKSIGPRTGVYGESSVIDQAAHEFGELEEMLTAVEKLYGAYRWDRYDLIVLPPSFPFGGMENPRITFATPTIIAGDRSLVSVVAHELSHSWSGNLVTSATWNDFWINEGFTVYLERRIMEELYGKSYTEMLIVLGYQDLQSTIEYMGQDNEDTHLKLNLAGRDPDEALTDIAYEKGALFLQTIEEAVGREKWDEFLKGYFDRFAFQSMTSDRFVEYLNKELIGDDEELAARISVNEWVYGPGIPETQTNNVSERLMIVDKAVANWESGTSPSDLGTGEWTTHEWLHFLRHLSSPLSEDKLSSLDKEFGFTNSKNAEIVAAWFIHVISNNYRKSYGKLEEFLVRVGRRKFLSPLYKELAKTEENKKVAIEIYKKARKNYHAISYGTVDGILGWEQSRYLGID
ncbi:MAG: aminopeptidase [Bacteroidetes bacterium]|nr:MAG: aminopeptidase [Bacteroidota bacterium]